MKKFNYLPLITLLVLCISCNQLNDLLGLKPLPGSEEKGDPNTAKIYHSNGKLKFECGIDSLKKRHGVARSYRENGVIEKEITYEHGVKTKAIAFYPNGKPQLEINYVDGLKSGIRKKYYENGKLESELEYLKNDEGKGLKEYSKSGKLRTSYPNLVIKPVDKINQTGQYILEVYFDKNPKRGQYYFGKLKDGKWLDNSLFKLARQKDGKATYIYEVPPGMFLMEKVTFVGKYRTPMNNTYIVEKSFNVAVENPI